MKRKYIMRRIYARLKFSMRILFSPLSDGWVTIRITQEQQSQLTEGIDCQPECKFIHLTTKAAQRMAEQLNGIGAETLISKN